MRYRLSKIKEKHGLIDGLLPFLRKLEKLEEVKAINPGEIKPGRLSVPGGLRVRVQYKTKSGLKLIARGQGVQEVFIISNKTDILLKKIEELPEIISKK